MGACLQCCIFMFKDFPFPLELKITIQFSKVQKVLPNVLNSPLDEEKQEQIVPEKSARLNLGTEILDFQ